MAIVAFAFNWQVLPRLGGRAMWREPEHGAGYPLGILLYPLSRARPDPRVPPRSLDGGRDLGRARAGRRHGLDPRPGHRRPAAALEPAQGLGRLLRLRRLRHDRGRPARRLDPAAAARGLGLADDPGLDDSARRRLRAGGVDADRARRQPDGSHRRRVRASAAGDGGAGPALRRSRLRAAPGRRPGHQRRDRRPGVEGALHRRPRRRVRHRHRHADHGRPRARRPGRDGRVLRRGQRRDAPRLSRQGRAGHRAGEGRRPRVAQRVGQRRRRRGAGADGGLHRRRDARALRPGICCGGGDRGRGHLLVGDRQGVRPPHVPHHHLPAGASRHRGRGQPRRHARRTRRRRGDRGRRRDGRPLPAGVGGR